MKVSSFTYIYLLGAGGIGMSALGRYFLMQGKIVCGYDKTSTTLTSALSSEGVKISFEDSISSLPEFLVGSPSEDVLVIYTPAIPKESIILNYIQEKGFRLMKRSEVLGLISASHKTIAVAGTHGKTTTSTLIAHMLESAGLSPVAFLGGISVNYSSNYLPGKPDSVLVAEADEYDRSFLKLFPDTGIITSVDADHLDIYGQGSELIKSFEDFASQVERKLILKKGLGLSDNLYTKASTYSTSTDADVSLSNWYLDGDKYHFSVKTKSATFENLQLGLAGFHNVENSLAAISVALDMGLDERQIRDSLASFQGVKRRFEYIIRSSDLMYIDDYAHHPAELNACIQSAQQMYPSKKITGVFQPHLFSRTRDFMDEFAQSLSVLDEVYLMDIYPAREKPIEGISSAALLEKITCKNKQVLSAQELPEALKLNRPEVLLTMGAGDIDQVVEPIKKILSLQ
ncbi:MAG: UDP-N-acetylmuramate--L-alanine ligase [Bacteroidia bacterium]